MTTTQLLNLTPETIALLSQENLDHLITDLQNFRRDQKEKEKDLDIRLTGLNRKAPPVNLTGSFLLPEPVGSLLNNLMSQTTPFPGSPTPELYTMLVNLGHPERILSLETLSQPPSVLPPVLHGRWNRMRDTQSLLYALHCRDVLWLLACLSPDHPGGQFDLTRGSLFLALRQTGMFLDLTDRLLQLARYRRKTREPEENLAGLKKLLPLLEKMAQEDHPELGNAARRDLPLVRGTIRELTAFLDREKRSLPNSDRIAVMFDDLRFLDSLPDLPPPMPIPGQII